MSTYIVIVFCPTNDTCKHIAWQIPQQTFGIRPTSRRFEIARLGYAIAVVQACVVNKKRRVHGRRPSKKNHAASQTGNVSCASQPSIFFSTAHHRIVGETVVERFVYLSFLTSWDSTQPLYESHGFPALVSVWKRSVVAVGGRDIITEKEFGDRRWY